MTNGRLIGILNGLSENIKIDCLTDTLDTYEIYAIEIKDNKIRLRIK